MATLMIGNVSLTGIQCIFQELDTAKERDVSIYFWHQMHLLVAPDMQACSTGIKKSSNTFHFGIKINMPLSVRFFFHHCNFLWNHYQEALKSIQTLAVELSAIKAELDITDDDFPRYLHQEHVYLDSLKQPPVRDQTHICYVEALDELTE
ncbi:uncharacterized protein EDB91DRAFT_1048296 [Suillus paluster]|uniref:uncharacterized protein n=1 Tax=Suillus paluster TaxID=48578 RepID=UPI001B865C96|nr:uncharacterized protein EDB91DRAFT_1048296 [Suillus paluster]KAG1747847.1 hypothetical protein EDB91DRAFT_1048296 [Suillus paluster]